MYQPTDKTQTTKGGVNMSKTDSRPYQLASIESLRQGFRDRHIRQVLAAPTGSGKSVVMNDMIKAAVAKGSRICFICERRILVEQFSRHLDSEGIEHGILMAKHWRFKPEAQVQIATAQTLEKMETWPNFDVCFVDEIHACMRRSIKQLMDSRPTLKVIGATATPFHEELSKYFTSVTSVITMRELVEQGYLVPYRVFVSHEIDTKGVKVVAGEWKKDDLEKRGQQIVGDVVADYIRISNEVFGGYRKTICFSCGIAHGADLALKFNEAGVNAVQISSNDEDDYRAEVLADFAKPDSSIKILISVAILSRGFDQTDVEHIILARPLRKSFSEHVQMMGRGARVHPDKDSLDKKFCVVQDNSGNFLRFQESWDNLYTNGVLSLGSGEDKKPRKEPTEKEKKASKCPKCDHLWPGGVTVCPCCGYERSKRDAVVAVAGEMTELTGKKDKGFTSEFKERFYQELIGYSKLHGYKDGWAYFKYKEKFEVGPNWKKQSAPPSNETVKWIVSRNIRHAHRRVA
jgi:DNA repair protein RadD